MIDLSLSEAKLFRILGAFFGKERVVPRMSVMAVCGGELPPAVNALGIDAVKWARSNNCLFTIIDHDDNPRMVMEFFSGYQSGIDVTELEHQRYLGPILKAVGIPYVTITNNEFEEILDPQGNLDFVSLLKDKVGYEGSDPP